MIVLGLHGWDGTHDAAAALLIDGQVVACVEEERLNRRKHAVSDRPRLSARAVLSHAGLGWDDVDCVSYGWNLPKYLPSHGQRWRFDSDRAFLADALHIQPRRWPKLEWIDHHLAHAAAGFYSSGFDRAAVLVVDGQGEDKSVTLYAGHAGDLRLIRDWPPSRSLGLLYEAATRYCGFGFLDAGKTMGLAAYGRRPTDPLPLVWDGDIRSPVPEHCEEDAVTEFWYRMLSERFGEPQSFAAAHDLGDAAGADLASEVARHRPDVAAAAQDAIERVLAGLVQYAQDATSCRNVVLTGGVALNCVANGLLAQQCDRLFVPPTAHDAGAAMGAAMVTARRSGDRIRPDHGADLGPRYTSAAIESMLAANKLRARKVDDPASEAAERLASGAVVGWFQGRSEIGPRALGHRSILALPSRAEQHHRVNRIKGRESWRPFAPSALASQTPWMFGRTVTSPYMLLSLPLTAAARQRLPAVAHIDGSTRVQTVADDGGDHRYVRLLARLGEMTGAGVVLNTSFNAAFEPIVCSPNDAVRSFFGMGLDVLLLEDFLLEKPA
jgi:carbamoyltransferase